VHSFFLHSAARQIMVMHYWKWITHDPRGMDLVTLHFFEKRGCGLLHFSLVILLL
jgi:hypothetical protein